MTSGVLYLVLVTYPKPDLSFYNVSWSKITLLKTRLGPYSFNMEEIFGNHAILRCASNSWIHVGESVSNVFEILSNLGHIIRLYQGYIKGIYQGYIKGISRVYQGYIKRIYQGYIKGTSRIYIKGISRVYQG